jgi:hypothetical protein
MRQALNSNPMVQLAVIGVLIAIVGLFMMMNLKKSKPSSASSGSDASALSSTASSSSSSAPSSTTPVTIPGAASAAPVAPTTGVAPSTGTVTPEALVPGPGLPADVVSAWKGGDAVVLLIVRGGGVDDRLVHRSVELLSHEAGVSVFVARAKNVARYSRITQGVGVNRAPALVVVRPRQESGSVPQAQVSYGFRNSQGVVQAVHDAVYSGRDDLPYSPR